MESVVLNVPKQDAVACPSTTHGERASNEPASCDDVPSASPILHVCVQFQHNQVRPGGYLAAQPGLVVAINK